MNTSVVLLQNQTYGSSLGRPESNRRTTRHSSLCSFRLLIMGDQNMQSTRVRVQAGMVAVVAGLVAVCAATGSRASAQDTYQYEQAENWAQIPEGAKWGTTSAVDINSKGTVYALQRSEPAQGDGLQIPHLAAPVVGRWTVRERARPPRRPSGQGLGDRPRLHQVLVQPRSKVLSRSAGRAWPATTTLPTR